MTQSVYTKKKLNNEIKKMIAGMLRIDENKLDIDDNLFKQEYGFSSKAFEKLTNFLGAKFNVDADVVDVDLNNLTIQSITDHLYNEFSDEFDHYYNPFIGMGNISIDKAERKDSVELLPDDEPIINSINNEIRKMVSSILDIQEEEIDFDTNILEYDFTSLTLMRLIEQINMKYSLGAGMNTFVDMTAPTVQSITNCLFVEYKEELYRKLA